MNTTPLTLLGWYDETRLKTGKERVVSSIETEESRYVSDIHKISYWWIVLYGSNKNSLLWASMLFTFQWKHKLDHKINQYLHVIDQYVLTSDIN